MTTKEAIRRREQLGEDNDRATVIFVAAGAAAITVTWAAFLVWVLI